MNTIWTQGLTQQEADEIKRIFELERNSKIWKRFLEVIQKRKEVLETSERLIETYDNPNWSHKQAHNNGAISQLNMIIKLFS